MIAKTSKAKAIMATALVMVWTLSGCTTFGARVEAPLEASVPSSAAADGGGGPTQTGSTIPAGWQQLSLRSLSFAIPSGWINIEERGDWGEPTMVWEYFGPWADDLVGSSESASQIYAQTATPSSWTPGDLEHSDSAEWLPLDGDVIDIRGATQAMRRTKRTVTDVGIEIWARTDEGRVYYLELSSPAENASLLEQIVGTITVGG